MSTNDTNASRDRSTRMRTPVSEIRSGPRTAYVAPTVTELCMSSTDFKGFPGFESFTSSSGS